MYMRLATAFPAQGTADSENRNLLPSAQTGSTGLFPETMQKYRK